MRYISLCSTSWTWTIFYYQRKLRTLKKGPILLFLVSSISAVLPIHNNNGTVAEIDQTTKRYSAWQGKFNSNKIAKNSLSGVERETFSMSDCLKLNKEKTFQINPLFTNTTLGNCLPNYWENLIILRFKRWVAFF